MVRQLASPDDGRLSGHHTLNNYMPISSMNAEDCEKSTDGHQHGFAQCNIVVYLANGLLPPSLSFFTFAELAQGGGV